jgi:carbon storage regulator
MLVLSRTLEEAIMIGDNIEITILEVKGDKVKLGISAPLDVPVHRKEIYLAIKQENIEAAGIDASEVAKVIGLLAKRSKKNVVKDRTK